MGAKDSSRPEGVPSVGRGPRRVSSGAQQEFAFREAVGPAGGPMQQLNRQRAMQAYLQAGGDPRALGAYAQRQAYPQNQGLVPPPPNVDMRGQAAPEEDQRARFRANLQKEQQDILSGSAAYRKEVLGRMAGDKAKMRQEHEARATAGQQGREAAQQKYKAAQQEYEARATAAQAAASTAPQAGQTAAQQVAQTTQQIKADIAARSDNLQKRHADAQKKIQENLNKSQQMVNSTAASLGQPTDKETQNIKRSRAVKKAATVKQIQATTPVQQAAAIAAAAPAATPAPTVGTTLGTTLPIVNPSAM